MHYICAKFYCLSVSSFVVSNDAVTKLLSSVGYQLKSILELPYLLSNLANLWKLSKNV